MQTWFRLLLSGLALAAGLRAADHDPALDLNLQFFRDLAETQNYSLGRPARAQLTPDGRTAIFLRGGARDPVLRLYAFDVATGTEHELLSPESILGDQTEVLTAEEKARRERARVRARGFTKFDLSEDGTRVLVTLSGKLYVIDRTESSGGHPRVTALPAANWIDPRFSPDGRYVAAAQAGELHVIDIATQTDTALTHGATATLSHGVAEFVAQEEMDRREGYWWSPDSNWLAYQETDESAVETRYIANPLHPEQPPETFYYPRAGSTNATVRLGLIPRGGGDTVWVKWDAQRYPYLTRVVWREAGAPPCLLVQDRDQQHQVLLAADPATGATRELLHESDPAWLNLDNASVMPHWLPGGRQFLWTTEQGGAWHVQLRRADGTLVRDLTPTTFVYKGLAFADAAHDCIYVRGGPGPVETQVWRFPLAGGEGAPVTTGFGSHSLTFARDGATMIHSFERLDGASGCEVLAADGRRLGEIASVAETPPAWPNVELTTAGPREFEAALVRPRNFHPGRKYPVILSVYAGPTATVVSATARGYLGDQWTADQGYIVVRIDGRGTPLRGRDWERAIRGNFIDVALHDQVEGLQALGAKYPELDLSRVGVEGWSFGGYFAAMAAIRRPDVFRCGIAGAPVVTWENYDTYYTERYLGLPQQDPDAYRVSSVLTYAGELKRPLLLIHGLTDDNVYFQHTLQLANALYLAGKPYELLPQTGTHMVTDPRVKLRQEQRMVEFFDRNLRDPR